MSRPETTERVRALLNSNLPSGSMPWSHQTQLADEIVEAVLGPPPTCGTPPNEGPEFDKIAASINSYIPKGEAYHEERFALHRWLKAAASALRTQGDMVDVEIKPGDQTPGPDESERARPRSAARSPGLALVKLPPNCRVADPAWSHRQVAITPPPASPVQALEVAAVTYARSLGAPSDPEWPITDADRAKARAYLQQCGFELALMVLDKLAPPDLEYRDGYTEATETLRRFQRRAAADAGQVV